MIFRTGTLALSCVHDVIASLPDRTSLERCQRNRTAQWTSRLWQC